MFLCGQAIVIKALPLCHSSDTVKDNAAGMGFGSQECAMLPPLADQLLDSLETGDVLLFSGKGLLSDVIRWYTGSPWTHIGLVVRFEEDVPPLLLEATVGNEAADLLTGKCQSGVTLVSLSSKLRNYPGDIVVRRRQGKPLSERQRRLVRRLVRRLYRRPYRNYLWRLLLDQFPGRYRDSGIFCSELVAEFYRRLGWLPADIRTGRVVPGHFAGESLPLQNSVLAPAQWLKGATLGEAEKKSPLMVAAR